MLLTGKLYHLRNLKSSGTVAAIVNSVKGARTGDDLRRRMGTGSTKTGEQRRMATRRTMPFLHRFVGTPTLTFLHDVKGWSYDYQFIEGRQVAIVALRADWKKNFYIEAQWTPIWGGDYNFTKDRDFISLFVGATF